MTTKMFILAHNQARMLASSFCHEAPQGWAAIFSEPYRNTAQNAKAHAMLTDIAKQVEYFGRKWPAGIWKRLTVAAFMRERNEQPLHIPALDGVGVDVIYEKTSQMSVRTMADYITWIGAFGDEKGVVWSEPKHIAETA